MYAQIVMTALLAGAAGDVGPAAAERPTATRRGAEDARPARDRASRLAGGRAGAMQLLDLIQTTVAPSSWQPYGPGSISVFGGGGGAAGGGRSGARRLVDVIQENVRPQTWDVNGGYGTISCVAAEVRERGEPRAKSREESGGARWKGCG